MSFDYGNLTFDEQGLLKQITYDAKAYGLNGILWTIEYLDKDGKVNVLTPKSNFEFCNFVNGNVLVLEWQNNQAVIRVEVRSEKSKSYWSISIQLLNDKESVNKVIFPIIKGFSTVKNHGSEDYLLVPWQNGWIVKNPIEDWLAKNMPHPFWLGRGGYKYETEYPASLSFQYSAYYNTESIGCYMATEDSDAHIKTFGFYLEGADDFCYKVTNYPENMGSTTSYCMPYEFVLDFFKGDWQTATQLYRKWATKQKWCKNRLSEKELNNNVIQTDLWRINHSTFDLGKRTREYFETSKTIANKLNCNLGLHWYGWNMGKHDVNYPEYISREVYASGWNYELSDWNKKLDGEGIVKIPYINARLWDMACPAWAEDSAINSALKNENGDLYYEPWTGDDSLKPMCPATALWQNKVNDFCSDYILNLGFDGIYIDQVGSYNATLCFDKTHPHPLGGGCWWNDSYHTMLGNLRKKVGKDKILTTESCCETYVDVFDMMLILDQDITPWFGFNRSTANKQCESVPLFSMIYGDYSVAYGSVCRFSDPLDVFEYKFIRNILWGFVPTVEGIEETQIQNEAYFDILRSGVNFYKQNKELLLFGRLISIPDIHSQNIELKWNFDGKEDKRIYPGIIASKWESVEGNKCTLLYNALNEDVTLEYENKKLTISKKTFTII